MIPKELRDTILSEAHDSMLAGNSGVTTGSVEHRYFYPGSRERCSICNFVWNLPAPKHVWSEPRGGFLQPIRVSDPFLRVHMDFCACITLSSERNKHILLAIFPMSKYVIAQAVARANAPRPAQFLVNMVVLVHGCSRDIHRQGFHSQITWYRRFWDCWTSSTRYDVE